MSTAPGRFACNSPAWRSFVTGADPDENNLGHATIRHIIRTVDQGRAGGRISESSVGASHMLAFPGFSIMNQRTMVVYKVTVDGM